jgi:glycogen debranching enzyme
VPYYDNNDDSTNVKVAHGFSYHNGPEWVWLYGYYIAAKCNFSKGLRKNQLIALLQPQAKHLYSS